MTIHTLKHRFTVDEYYRMTSAGIFSEDDRVELIEGDVLQMAPIGSRHAACVDRLNRLFSRRLSDIALIRVQNPIQLDEFSEPLPDIAVVELRTDFYKTDHPKAAQIKLLVEVAETSAAFDRDVKVPLYAQAGIPEVWLVVLSESRVQVYRHPSDKGYKECHELVSGARIGTLAFPTLTLAVDDILA